MPKTLKDLTGEEYTFKLQRLGAKYAVDAGIMMKPERFAIGAVKYESAQLLGQLLMQATVNVLTQEEELAKVPADWWQHVKERWFPRWLLRRYPVKTNEIWAVHKFPELDSPIAAREFVHIKVIQAEEFDKLTNVSEN